MSGVFLDSWWEPSAGAISWAKAQGFVGWLGYFAEFPGNDRIYHGWADSTFLAIKAAGLVTGDYCSGLDDPMWVRSRCARLGIIGLLDCESSVKGDGPWVDPWLAASGERLYGGADVMRAHGDHGHPGYCEAGYPSNSGTQNPIDPGLTWTVPLPSPSRPIGRQYAGGVGTPYGAVDYSHFAPGFFAPVQGGLMDNDVATAWAMLLWLNMLGRGPDSTASLQHTADQIIANGLTATMWALAASPEGKAYSADGSLASRLVNAETAIAKLAAGGAGTPAAPAAHDHRLTGTTGGIV